MANTTFQLRRSSVAGKVPNTSTLSIGELGLNLTDQILYSSNGTGVFELGANVTNQTVKTSLLVGNSTVNTAITSTGITQNGLNFRVPKNYIVNPGMRISQENGTSSGTATGYYPADQWFSAHSQDGTLTFQQVTSATPGGSENRIRMTVTSADTSIAAGQYALLIQNIEGLRTADLQWGTSNATDVVVRFGFKGPAGTYAVSIVNQDINRSFVREFTISGGDSNTDTLQTVTFPGDTTGTWDKDNTLSFRLFFTFAVGSTWHGTPDAWQAGYYFGTSSTSNGIGTTSDVFEIFDVGMYADPDSTGLTPRFELPHYDIDLLECQRYYVQFSNVATYYPGTSATAVYESTQLPTDMRTTPSLSVVSQFKYYSGGGGTNFTPSLVFFTPRNIAIYGTGLTNANGMTGAGVGAANARM